MEIDESGRNSENPFCLCREFPPNFGLIRSFLPSRRTSNSSNEIRSDGSNISFSMMIFFFRNVSSKFFSMIVSVQISEESKLDVSVSFKHQNFAQHFQQVVSFTSAHVTVTRDTLLSTGKNPKKSYFS